MVATAASKPPPDDRPLRVFFGIVRLLFLYTRRLVREAARSQEEFDRMAAASEKRQKKPFTAALKFIASCVILLATNDG